MSDGNFSDGVKLAMEGIVARERKIAAMEEQLAILWREAYERRWFEEGVYDFYRFHGARDPGES